MIKKLFIATFFISLSGLAQAQKGEKSLSAGLQLSIPSRYDGHAPYIKTGGGIEVNGLYKFTNRSGVQVQAAVSSYRNRYFPETWSVFSPKVGYQYQFGSSGFYLNALPGLEFDFNIGDPAPVFSLGAGKRFIIADTRFIDAGLDYIDGDTEPRVNVKVAFGFIRMPRAKVTTAP